MEKKPARRDLEVAATIPIQNLYYLFLYAWDKLEAGQAIDVGGVESPDLVDMFAKVLAGGLKHLLRRGIRRDYIPIREDSFRLRGRVNFADSMEHIMRHAPRLNCEFDELKLDIPENQVLKATASRLTRAENIDKEIAHDLRLRLKSFHEVSDVRLSRQTFRQVQIHRNNAFYDFLIKVCELIFEATLPEGGEGRYRFSDILRDEQKMALVFEAFVRNFLRLELRLKQDELQVTPLEMKWDAAVPNEQLHMLPVMRTDIHLKNTIRPVIIDTKYYSETLQTRYEKKKLRSEHLYQIFAYLKNSERLGQEYEHSEGILLYPAVGEKVDFRAEIQGHPVRVCTVNLDQDWRLIREDLLALVRVAG